jgi:hypothetical protein
MVNMNSDSTFGVKRSAPTVSAASGNVWIIMDDGKISDLTKEEFYD